MRHTPAAARPVAKRLSRLSQLLLGVSLLFGASMAWAADLFVVTAPNRFAEVSPGVYPLRVNADALANMVIGDSVRLNLPGLVEQAVVLDRLEEHNSGNVTWIGHLQGRSDDYRVIVTLGANGAIGQILLPDAAYRIEPNQVVAPAAAGEESFVPGHNDGLALPLNKRAARVEAAGDNTFAATTSTRIDVLVLYTAGLPALYSGGIDALIDHLVALSNQAYIDSGIAIQIHLVGKIKTNYGEDTDNDQALTDLTDASDIALTQAPNWRTQYGADLVTLVRPFNKTYMTSCGVGWVNGGGGSSFDPGYAYSVVSYGKSVDGQKYLCSDYTFTHELGHNMGAAHDRKTQNEYSPSSYSGAYPYSYGYGYAGTFGTIMSYIDPRVGKFSNPAISCASGYLCGVSENDPKYGANNALTLNNTRGYVAAFMPTVVDPPLIGIALSSASVRVGTTVTISPVPGAAALGSCSSDNSSVASVSGATISTLAAGTANISCSGFSASLTVLPPLPVQAFGVTASQSAASNGNVKLQLTLSPDAADIGKTADLYLVAHALVGSVDYWFVQYANGSWAPLGSTLLPFATRTLVSSDSSIVALNGEFAAATLQSLALDFYLGYTLSGASLSTLKYQKAYAFR